MRRDASPGGATPSTVSRPALQRPRACRRPAPTGGARSIRGVAVSRATLRDARPVGCAHSVCARGPPSHVSQGTLLPGDTIMRTRLLAAVALAAVAACRNAARSERPAYLKGPAADSPAPVARADFVARAPALMAARER